jgi:hypothetical protein
MEETPGHVERTEEQTGSGPVATWRLALGALVLLVLIALGAALTPIYLHNLSFQHYVSALAEDPKTHERDDSLIRSSLVEKAEELKLPVHFENIQIARTAETVRITVRYVVHVNLVVYAVDLHFYPGAGSR